MAFLLGMSNLILFLAGVPISGERPPLALVLGQSALVLLAAWGMWRARYWAVLGMQALLALTIIFASLSLLNAFASGDFVVTAVALVVIGGAGTLFFFMVKAMARIQMPERR